MMTETARSDSTQRVVIITGAARRIGKALAISLHERGWRTSIHCHRSTAAADALVAALNAKRDASACSVCCDLADTSAATTIVDATLRAFGRIDALINNACSFYPTPVEDLAAVDVNALFAINATAPLMLSRAVVAELVRHRGTIINLSDMYARRPRRDYVAYGASKAALDAITRAMALELAPDVRVNGLHLGAVLMPNEDVAYKQFMIQRTPLARLCDVSDVTSAVRWLIEDAAGTTGHLLDISGGRLLTSSISWIGGSRWS